MEFRNLTPFPAMAFDSLDQHDRRFHTVVMRLTFALQDDGRLALAPVQTPLATSDDYFGEPNRSSVRQESDLAPYKPHTDVILIADAVAPQGRPKPTKRFDVTLQINGAPTVPELPPEPHGMNPTYRASCDQLAAWRQRCARLSARAAAGPVVLSKTLTVTGAREWRKRSLPLRALSMLTLAPWRLTPALPVTTLPLRYEYAYGGENKILAGEHAARRVGTRHRLPGHAPQSGLGHADEAIAHAVCEQNPVGRGFAEPWFRRATRLTRVPAPQIEAPGEPVSRLGKPSAPQGFGVIGRAWTPRLALAGTYDQRWLDERHPYLPADFDFGYWNGAPLDQQVTPHLTGDEQITLMNLSVPTAHAAHDADGNARLTFALPGHLPFVLVRFEDGRIGELAARFDTLMIDAAPDADAPDKRLAVVCVWRATVATEPAVRVLEARMLSAADVAALRQGAPDGKPAQQPHLAVVSG